MRIVSILLFTCFNCFDCVVESHKKQRKNERMIPSEHFDKGKKRRNLTLCVTLFSFAFVHKRSESENFRKKTKLIVRRGVNWTEKDRISISEKQRYRVLS